MKPPSQNLRSIQTTQVWVALLETFVLSRPSWMTLENIWHSAQTDRRAGQFDWFQFLEMSRNCFSRYMCPLYTMSN